MVLVVVRVTVLVVVGEPREPVLVVVLEPGVRACPVLPCWDCCCDWLWFVIALFCAVRLAVELAVCVAELGPELALPAAIEDGAFVFTAFCVLCADPMATCVVSAF